VPAALSRDPRVQLVGLLRRFRALTRAELAEYLGVSTAMVGEWLADLMGTGLVEDAGTDRPRGGRPPKRVTLSGQAAHALGLDLSGWPVRAVVRDLVGTVLFEKAFSAGDVAEIVAAAANAANAGSPAGSGGAQVARAETGGAPYPAPPPTAVPGVAAIARAAIQRSGVPAEQIRATGIALAGFVDSRRGTHRPDALPGGTPIPTAAGVAEQLGIPVRIEDMARAAAVAEARDGAAAGIANLLFLTLGDRIGAALILDGELYQGATGVVGELGHVVVREGGPRCTCGNLGCVQALASRPVLLRRVADAIAEGAMSILGAGGADPGALDLAAVVEAAGRGDRLATSVLRQAGQDVGRALAAGVNLLGPTMVVLGGYAPSLGDVFVDEVRRVLETEVVPIIWERLSIGVGILGASASALGAAWVALDQLVDSGALVGWSGRTRRQRAARRRRAATVG
jgi:glucokinase